MHERGSGHLREWPANRRDPARRRGHGPHPARLRSRRSRLLSHVGSRPLRGGRHRPSLIARAIGHGRQAAIAVHKALSGIDPAENIDIWIDETGRVREDHVPALPAPHVVAFKEIMHADYHEHAARQILPPAASDGPELAFAELSGGLAAEAAVAEAGRCMHCGHCMECGSCVESCPGHILEMTDDGPAVAYPSQCWHCGCCRIACPTGSIAYRFPMTMML